MLKKKKTSKSSFLNCVTLKEISNAIDISYQTLNYYSALGLLRPKKRAGNTRLYLLSEIEDRLAKIAKLKDKGYPLKVISDLLNSNKEDGKNELL